MRKLLLLAGMLLSITMFSQETFVKKYTSMISKKNDVLEPWEKIDLTVVFNADNKRNIIFYYLSGKQITFYQILGSKEGKTENGEGYQLIDCIDEDGQSVALQLFDDDTCLRILIAKGYSIEFHR